MTEMNETPNVYAVPYPTEPVTVPQMPIEETVPPTQTEEPAPKQKKNVGYRVFAAILAVAAIAVAFLCKFAFLWLNLEPLSFTKELTFFNAVKDTFSEKAFKLFGIFPHAFPTDDIGGKIAALAFYASVCSLVLTVVLGVITVFTNKKAPAMFSATAFFFTATFATLAASVWAYVTATQTYEYELNYILLGLIAAGLICFVVTALIKNGKTAWFNLLQFILTLAAMGAAIYCLVKYLPYMAILLDDLLKWSALAIAAVASLAIILGAIRLHTKKGVAFDIVRFIVQFVLGVFVCYVAIACNDFDGKTTFLIFAIVAAAVSLVQIVLAVIVKKAGCAKAEAEDDVCESEQAETVVTEKVKKEKAKKEKKAKKQKVVKAQPVAAPEFVVEEYAEALPYTGGPVEGVEIAQEVNPTYVAPPPPVQTAGYDFYNSKSFDPFIAILGNEERNQFTEIFILKYKGDMPEIPTYQVGGDNKEFFRKTFIYLGQYRDKIPDGLLAKMYQFSIKM
ncbi:MAG: hypothetical protein IJ317_00855 [Clostridia bacterium]|nr:hypothetical protein [Clostridia bacterium]